MRLPWLNNKANNKIEENRRKMYQTKGTMLLPLLTIITLDTYSAFLTKVHNHNQVHSKIHEHTHTQANIQAHTHAQDNTQQEGSVSLMSPQEGSLSLPLMSPQGDSMMLHPQRAQIPDLLVPNKCEFLFICF